MATGTAEAAGLWHVLSQTAEYALRAVLYIGGHAPGTAVPVADIAGALGVPEKYLGRVLNTLRRAGTLRSKRGVQGGFWLTRPAGSVTLYEVVAPFEPVGEPQPCLMRGGQCGAGGRCSAHELWRGMAAGVRDFFERTTVADLLHEASAATQWNGDD